jgi:hypothetical protein
MTGQETLEAWPQCEFWGLPAVKDFWVSTRLPDSFYPPSLPEAAGKEAAGACSSVVRTIAAWCPCSDLLKCGW